jgi:ornithine cyclodeaminase
LRRRGVKANLRHADREGIPYVVIVGAREREAGQVMLRQMTTRTEQLLAPDALIDAVADGFRALSAGEVDAPPRQAVEGEGGSVLTMAGRRAGGPVVVKLVGVFPGNADLRLETHQAVICVFDATTGRCLALMDGEHITALRTAAAAALSVRALARPDARRMAMVGAGALAPFLIWAQMSQRPIEAVALWNHHPERAEALADALRREGLPVTATADLEAAVRAADIVSCETLSAVPLIRGAWLKPGSHLDLVGAFHPGAREADDAALRRASVYVDTPSALTEGGDVAVGLQAGAIDATDVRGGLFGLCRGTAQGRARPDEITLFKSVGAAIEDLAAAALAWNGLT